MIYAFFGPDGRLDRSAMRRQMEAFVHSGVHGIAVLGIVTEFNKLDVNERRTIIEWSAEDLAGRLPLAVTINEPSVGGQIEIARLAAEVNADWLILQPPINRNVPESELVGFLARSRRRDAAGRDRKRPINLDVRLSFDALNDLQAQPRQYCPAQGRGPDRVRSSPDRRNRRRLPGVQWTRRARAAVQHSTGLRRSYSGTGFAPTFWHGSTTCSGRATRRRKPRPQSYMRAFFRCSLSSWRRPSIYVVLRQTPGCRPPGATRSPSPAPFYYAVRIWSGDRRSFDERMAKAHPTNFIEQIFPDRHSDRRAAGWRPDKEASVSAASCWLHGSCRSRD